MFLKNKKFLILFSVCKFDGLNHDHYQLKNKIFLRKFCDLTENGNLLFFQF